MIHQCGGYSKIGKKQQILLFNEFIPRRQFPDFKSILPDHLRLPRVSLNPTAVLLRRTIAWKVRVPSNKFDSSASWFVCKGVHISFFQTSPRFHLTSEFHLASSRPILHLDSIKQRFRFVLQASSSFIQVPSSATVVPGVFMAPPDETEVGLRRGPWKWR